jgi:hypothetical protein
VHLLWQHVSLAVQGALCASTRSGALSVSRSPHCNEEGEKKAKTARQGGVQGFVTLLSLEVTLMAQQ